MTLSNDICPSSGFLVTVSCYNLRLVLLTLLITLLWCQEGELRSTFIEKLLDRGNQIP